MATQKELVNTLVADVEVLKTQLASLEGRFDSFSTPPQPEVKLETPASPEVKPTDYLPVPPDYVDTVDLVLNKNFGIRFEPQKDAPSFLFTIVVPPKYSRVKEGEDIRTKVITYSDGANGVRLWAEKVYETFDSDTKFRIVEDRPFAQRPI